MLVARVVTFRASSPVAGVDEEFPFAQKRLTRGGDCGRAVRDVVPRVWPI